jgi:hypothetical protein
MTRDSDFVNGLIQCIDEQATRDGVESPTWDRTTTVSDPQPTEIEEAEKNAVELALQRWIERRFWEDFDGQVFVPIDLQMWLYRVFTTLTTPHLTTFSDLFNKLYAILDTFLWRCGIDRNMHRCVLILCTDSGTNEARRLVASVRSLKLESEFESAEQYEMYLDAINTHYDPHRRSKDHPLATKESTLPERFIGRSFLRNSSFMKNVFYPLLSQDIQERYASYELILHGFHHHDEPIHRPAEIHVPARVLAQAANPVEGDFKIITWSLAAIRNGYRAFMYSGDGDELPASWIQLALLEDDPLERWFWCSSISYRDRRPPQRWNERVVVHDVIGFYWLLMGFHLPREMPLKGLFWAVFCFLRGCDYTQNVPRFTLNALQKSRFEFRGKRFIDVGETPGRYLWFRLTDYWRQLIVSCGLKVTDQSLAQAEYTLNEFYRQPRVWNRHRDNPLPMTLSVDGKPFYGFAEVEGKILFATEAISRPHAHNEPLTAEVLEQVGRRQTTDSPSDSSSDEEEKETTPQPYYDNNPGQLAQEPLLITPPPTTKKRRMNASTTSLRNILSHIGVAPSSPEALRPRQRSLSPLSGGTQADSTDPNWPFRVLSGLINGKDAWTKEDLAQVRRELNSPGSPLEELVLETIRGSSQRTREPFLRAVSDLFIFHGRLIKNSTIEHALESDGAIRRTEVEHARSHVLSSFYKDTRLFFTTGGGSGLVHRFGAGIPLPRSFQSFADMVDILISEFITRLLLEHVVSREGTAISPALLHPATGRFYSGWGHNLSLRAISV